MTFAAHRATSKGTFRLTFPSSGTSMQRYLAGNYSRWRTVRSTYDPRGVIAAPIAV